MTTAVLAESKRGTGKSRAFAQADTPVSDGLEAIKAEIEAAGEHITKPIADAPTDRFMYGIDPDDSIIDRRNGLTGL